VRGTRITVGDILSYVASGMREVRILADFPQLTRDDIRAYLAYAAWEVSPRAGRPKPVKNSQWQP
jgi:uncharacterized protein (DUF433 family)